MTPKKMLRKIQEFILNHKKTPNPILLIKIKIFGLSKRLKSFGSLRNHHFTVIRILKRNVHITSIRPGG